MEYINKNEAIYLICLVSLLMRHLAKVVVFAANLQVDVKASLDGKAQLDGKASLDSKAPVHG